MKKMVITISIMLFILLSLDGNTWAEEKAELRLNNSKETLEIGEEFEIWISIENIQTIAYELTLNWDTAKLELLSEGENIHVVDNRILCIWYDTTGGNMPKKGELVRFRFRSKQAGSVHFLAQGEIYNEVGSGLIMQTTETKIEINEPVIILPVDPEVEDTQRENNTNLENLAIQDTLLYPPFEPLKTHYTAEVGNAVTTLELLAVPEQESAIIAIQGNQAIQEGENIIIIQVTAPSGAKKEYEIQVYKRNAEEEAAYEKEQAQMPEKVKQAYEIEKLSASIAKEEISQQETKQEEKQTKRWEGFGVLFIGIVLGALWYVVERKKKKKI